MQIFDPYGYDLAVSAGQAPLAADALLEVPHALRGLLWHGLMQAAAGAVDLWERTPPGTRSLPPSPVQHAGKRHFLAADLRQQTLAGWHRLVGIELRLAVEALEALALAGDVDERRALLAEECARVGQLYTEMERRAGEWTALTLLRWELRLLRYRASPAVSTLVYD